MIRKAASFLRPQGILLYSTCSLEPEEGEFHIPALPENLEFLPFSAGDFAFQPQWVDNGGFLKTTPDQGLDGFFAMRLKKL
jgi:16S rRNA (cytosine967-C5)-methyltransferase